MEPEQNRQDGGVPTSPAKPMVGNEFGARPTNLTPEPSQNVVEPVPIVPNAPIAAPVETVQQLQAPSVPPTSMPQPQPQGFQPLQQQAQPIISPPQPMQPSMPQPLAQQSATPTAGKNKKLITLVTVALIVLLLVGIALFGFIWWKNNQISLETYKGADYSILVPSGYEEDSTQSTDTSKMFAEPDASSNTQSYVGAGVEAYTDGQQMSDVQFEQFKKAFGKSFVEDSLKEEDDNGVSVTNATITVSEKSGSLTYAGTGDMQKDGKTVGKATFMFRFTKVGAEFVVVAANKTDPALQKNAQKIVDSFTVQ